MKLLKNIKKLGLLLTIVTSSCYPLIAAIAPSVPAAELSSASSTKKIDYNTYITDGFLLPRHLYALKSDGLNANPFNLYYRNVYSSLTTNYHLASFAPYGQSINGRWYVPSILEHVPEQSFDINFVVNTGKNITSQSTHLTFPDMTNQNPVRLLAIGDSLTRAGVYLSQVASKLPNVTMLGTRYYPEDGHPPREGRGGWRLEDYFNFPNGRGLDSPFIFPENVSGKNYKGNTQDWKNICYDNPRDPIYNGFQQIARGFIPTGNYLYNENGYYKYPSIGDVMCDPSLRFGTRWIEWNGSSWGPLFPKPQNFEFNFTKYMERYQAAFTEGPPTHISILLGANDFGFSKEIDQIQTFIDRLNIMIDSIHAFDPSIKVILCLPTLGPNPDLITSSNKDFYSEYNLCIKYASSKLLEAFDTDEALARHIYLAPMTLTVDSNSGFDYITKTETVNNTPVQVRDVRNSIHPNNTIGQIQMGDTLAAVIQQTR